MLPCYVQLATQARRHCVVLHVHCSHEGGDSAVLQRAVVQSANGK